MTENLLSHLIASSENFDRFKIQSFTGRASNGYLEYIFRKAAADLFKV